MGACAIITGSAASCAEPLKASVAEKLLIGNLEDIENIIYDPATPDLKVIQDIIMKDGTSLYIFEGIRSSNRPETGLIPDDFSTQFFHQIDFSAFQVDAEHKNNLQRMASTKTFAIYQNPKDSSLGDAVWEALGINSGLEMSVLQRLPASKDGSYKIQLRTPELAAETSLPNSVWDTDIATTEAMLAEITSGDNMLLSTATAAAGSDIVLVFTDALGAPVTMVNVGNIGLGGTQPGTMVSATLNTPASGCTIVSSETYIGADEILLTGTFQHTLGTIQLSNFSIIVV